MDFSIPIYPDQIGLIKQSGGAVALNYWVYVDVFRNTLWLGILGALVCLAAAIGFILYHLAKNSTLCDSFLESFAFVTRLLIQRDVNMGLQALSYR